MSPVPVSMGALACALSVGLAAWLAAGAWPELQAAVRQRGSGAFQAWRGRLHRPWRIVPGRFTILNPARGRPSGRGTERAAEALEGLLVTVIAHLQAGRPLRQAWIEAAREVAAPVLEPAKGEFLAALGAGLPLEEALGLWHGQTGLRALRRCQAVASAHRRTGGDVTGPTLAVIQSLREQRLAWAEVAARTAEARLSARLLALLPVAVAAYALAMDPAFLGPLWEDPLGRGGLLYAVVSWLAGLYLLRRLSAALNGAGEE
ncbi:type II secretion system F family protein [Thermaerobacter subterraneus]|uniref:Flp pilus assembly protein TadB n=1 Tax=Thermaerobacter subterraneus DSM 13965 TaxID=867903 RepID=K6QBP0_9FIRM|nr:type II secretion system F family protein [Thermaerobacter subterraneus]EKP93801.1 Flp pilus assembly protein TadB [Thermaerobacter subterraneus DSM 13965]